MILPPVLMVQEPPVLPPIQLAQAKKKREDNHLKDIVNSIWTAILVQNCNYHSETKIVEVNNQIGGINLNAIRGFQEDNGLHKTGPQAGLTTNGVVSNAGTGSSCDIEPKLENGEICLG